MSTTVVNMKAILKSINLFRIHVLLSITMRLMRQAEHLTLRRSNLFSSKNRSGCRRLTANNIEL